MAERRMFAKSVTNSARFLMMPAAARLLYYDLGMHADDDGVVEAFTVMRTTNATEADLQVLVAKGFIRVLNDDLVSHVVNWKQNNLIRGDRYKKSVYAELLEEGETNGKPSVNQRETQVRLGEESKGKESGGENTPRTAYGIYKNVFLTDEEYKALQLDVPDLNKTIDKLSMHIKSTGRTYASHEATVRKWAMEDAEKKTDARSSGDWTMQTNRTPYSAASEYIIPELLED